MKIKCSYCGNSFNDTLEKCPGCGAPNEGVVRTTDKQPVTIEQLKEWYASKGLPPYEVTRFFIGENYTKPKAFGIYKDEQTGNFVVYKNKASGERAVRYEGTDEAYAVNELFQRLKQEIIQQKSNNVKKNAGGSSSAPPPKKSFAETLKYILRPTWWKIPGLPVIVFIVYFGVIDPATIPVKGYYSCDSTVFYHISSDSRDDWYVYDSTDDDWSAVNMYEIYPEIYDKRKAANEYLTAEEWNSALPCSDFTQSVAYSDYIHDFKVNTGYYSYDDDTYYHLYDDHDDGWYYYNYAYSRWDPADYSSVPDELTHYSVSEDFYFTPTWDSSTQFSDFEDTAYYSDYVYEQEKQDDWNNDDDDDYDWDSNDSWDYDSMDWDSDW